MKWIFLLLLATPVFAGDFVGSRVSRYMENTYNFQLSRSALDKAPHWKEDEDTPSLPARKAQTLALAQAQRLRPEVTIWRTTQIVLEALPSTDQWIYIVRLQDGSANVGGVPWQLDIPVYMDGSTITPVVKKNPSWRPSSP